MERRKIKRGAGSGGFESENGYGYSPGELEFIEKLQGEFPEFSFRFGPRFKFVPPRTVFIGPPQPNFALLALHEVGHGVSGQFFASTHVSRIRIECRAWYEAKTLVLKHPEWGVEWDEEFAEENLDSYRDWLHGKSRCKKCGLVRCQDENGEYFCPGCDLI